MFNVVEMSLSMTTLETKIVSYALGLFKVYIESVVVRIKILIGNTSNQNFEIAILFNVFERFGNYVFKDNKPLPPFLGAIVVSCALGQWSAYLLVKEPNMNITTIFREFRAKSACLVNLFLH